MSKYNEKQRKWADDYLRRAYSAIHFARSKEEIVMIKAAALEAGMSVNGFIRDACFEKMERDGLMGMSK